MNRLVSACFFSISSAISAGMVTDLALQTSPMASMTISPPLEKAISWMLWSTRLSLAATSSPRVSSGWPRKWTIDSSSAERWARKSRLSLTIC
jgi:hypothetical protein